MNAQPAAPHGGLSAVVITYNEEHNIARCLEALRGLADELVVLDSYSTDRTPELCRQLGARFHQHAFDDYASQKNRALALARHEWVLSLDADEVPSPELAQAIREAIRGGRADAFRLNRLPFHGKTPIRHGDWHPDFQTRLFRRGEGTWQGMLVHERLALAPGARVADLDGLLFHHTVRDIRQHQDQANRFSTLKALEDRRRGRRFNWFLALVKPPLKFLRHYVLKLGFLDGFHGYLIARMAAHETFLRFMKLRELDDDSAA